jgi:hypothetical protein
MYSLLHLPDGTDAIKTPVIFCPLSKRDTNRVDVIPSHKIIRTPIAKTGTTTAQTNKVSASKSRKRQADFAERQRSVLQKLAQQQQ